MGERFARPAGWMQRAFRQSPPAFRRGAAMLVDAAIVIESFAIALLFRFNGDVQREWWITFWPFAIFAALLVERGGTLAGIALALACCVSLAALPRLLK